MSTIRHIASSNLRRSEQGMVALMTTMVLMIVITLVVLGFAQIARRNQRESLDRQLSTQAFYAAETGINDARKIIQTAAVAGNEVQDKTSCGGTGDANFYVGLDPDIDSDKNVKYTCLLVDASPKSLQYSSIGTTTTVVPVISKSGTPISTITLDWQTKLSTSNATSGCPTSVTNVFVPTGGVNWPCSFGLLRFDLVPTAGVLTADGLRNATMTLFAVPFSSGGVNTVAYAPGNSNANNRLGVRCVNGDPGCSLTITGLTQNSYHLRVTSLYRDDSLAVTPKDGTGSGIEIKGAQAVIDVTGRAQDVLRRIKVSVPLTSTSKNQLSDYAIEMNGALCKRYAIMNGYISNQVSGVTSSNTLCQTFTSP